MGRAPLSGSRVGRLQVPAAEAPLGTVTDLWVPLPEGQDSLSPF